MTPYRFVTELAVAAPSEAVYSAIVDPGWVDDWGDATHVERTREGDATGLGACFMATVRAPVGYTMSARIETVEAVPCRRVLMVSEGSVEGTGLWELEETAGSTAVTFTWDVRTTEPWMNLLAPIARPLFERSHGVVMRNAAEAAARSIEAELVVFRSRSVRAQPER